MALNTSPEVKAKVETKVEVKKPDVMILELALYSIYNWQEQTFEKGKGYRFSRPIGEKLLGVMDCGRAVWRIYQPPQPKTVVAKPVVEDATQIVDVIQPKIEQGFVSADKGIELGDEAEIADVLGKINDPENVTV